MPDCFQTSFHFHIQRNKKLRNGLGLDVTQMRSAHCYPDVEITLLWLWRMTPAKERDSNKDVVRWR